MGGSGTVGPGDLTVAKLKKDEFRDRLVQFHEQTSCFSLLWKDLDDHYSATHEALERKAEEVRSREESLREVYLEVTAKQEECWGLEELIVEQCKDLYSKADEFGERYRAAIEEKFADMEREIERRVDDLEEKEKSFDLRSAEVQRLIDERFEEVEMKEKQLARRKEEVRQQAEQVAEKFRELEAERTKLNERLEEFELANLQFELDSEKLSDRLREVESKDQLTKQRLRDLDSKGNELQERSRELILGQERFDLDRFELNEQLSQVELKDKQLEERAAELESENKQLEVIVEELQSSRRKFELDRGKLDERLRELESNKKEFNSDREKLDERLRKLDKKSRELDLKAEQLEGRCSELDSSRKGFEEQVEKFKLTESKLEERRREVEQKLKQSEEKCKEIQNLRLRGCVTVDGKNLQVLLNGCWKEHEKLRYGVKLLLRMSPDPARVVLDAVQGFFPPHLKKGDVEFKGSDVRASYILLLEQLMNISPNIDPDVQSEARTLSFDWAAKLRANPEHSEQILGFLLLVAVYKLRKTFGDGKLITYVKVIAQRRQLPRICQVLGFGKEIPGIIRDLKERNEHLAVIGFSSTFHLFTEFPPDPILKEFLDISTSVFKTIFDNGNSSLEAQIQATNKRVSELKAAMGCIEDYKLKLGFTPESMWVAIWNLEKELAKRIRAATAAAQIKLQESNDKNDMVCIPPRISSPVRSSMPVSASCSVAEKAAVKVALGTPLRPQRFMENSRIAVPQQAVASAHTDENICAQSLQPESAQSVGLLAHPDDLSKVNVIWNAMSTSLQNGTTELRNSPVHVGWEGLRLLLRRDVAYKLVRHKVINILKSSSEPANLVFDALWHPHFSSPGEDGFSLELGIPLKGSILLLKELKQVLMKKLNRVSCVIKPKLHRKAGDIAKSYQSSAKNNTMGLIFFLQFIDAYKVPHSADDVISLLDPSTWRKQFPDSCQLLGLHDFIPNFIRSLVQKNQRLNAIKYIHALGLESEFNVIAILRDHLEYGKNKAGDLAKGSSERAFAAKLEAANDVVACIRMCKLESTFPPKEFEEYIENLKKQKSEKVWESEESKAAKPLAGLKRKATSVGISESNTNPKRPWQTKRKIKFIGESDPGFKPPPRPKPYVKRRWYRDGMNRPLMDPLYPRRGGRAQFEPEFSTDTPY